MMAGGHRMRGLAWVASALRSVVASGPAMALGLALAPMVSLLTAIDTHLAPRLPPNPASQ